mmetsp:Transcript_37264/g.111106  ORF Transcript_37264/g.111106 Transcript_37264/m.111106 type:complete len:215 (-) Transcript_37264:1556-2200(-)
MMMQCTIRHSLLLLYRVRWCDLWSRLDLVCGAQCVCDPCACAAPRNRAAVVKNNRTGAPEFRCAQELPGPPTRPRSAHSHRDAPEQRRAAARSRLTSGGRGSRPSCPSLPDTPRNDAHGPATRDLTLAQRGARCAGGRQQCGPASRCCRHPLLTSRSPPAATAAQICAASRRRRLAASRRARQTQSARCWRRRTSSCPTLAAARASHRRATPSL